MQGRPGPAFAWDRHDMSGAEAVLDSEAGFPDPLQQDPVPFKGVFRGAGLGRVRASCISSRNSTATLLRRHTLSSMAYLRQRASTGA